MGTGPHFSRSRSLLLPVILQHDFGLAYDLRSPDWLDGHDTYLVMYRKRLLIERCLTSLHKGDIVCVEGSLVLKLLRSNGDLVPLAEILASNVILLTRRTILCFKIAAHLRLPYKTAAKMVEAMTYNQ